jgi:hypothetical protein
MKYGFMKPYFILCGRDCLRRTDPANTIIRIQLVVASDNSYILMLSTKSRKKRQFALTSNLAALLKERGKTQEDLAVKTGLRPERISRLVHQHIVRRIFAETSIAICLAISAWPRLKDRKKVSIKLDALFPMRRT